MPIIRSAKKRMRQNVRRRARNRSRRATLRTSLKNFVDLIEAGDAEAAKAKWPETQGVIDRTARLGIIHPNKAARTKSRLQRRLSQLSS